VLSFVVTVASFLLQRDDRGLVAVLRGAGGEGGDRAEDRRLVGVLLQAGGLGTRRQRLPGATWSP
jgi:hypothetical protein